MVNEQGEVLECFNPLLDGDKLGRFQLLVEKIDSAFPNYRDLLIQNELKAFQANSNNIEDVKYVAVLNVLADLCQQGWQLEVYDSKLYLKMSAQSSVDKEYIRFRLSSEKKAQFQEPSVQRFIEKMEQEKTYNGMPVSIKSLVGNCELLIHKIQANEDPIVEPYIQLVTHSKDEHTGYWLSDIWRYFRYTWSIPYKTMPGRNLFYLVRDASQPSHPVIGIFALGNSVLNLTVRDDEIGWTVEAIAKQLSRKEQIDHSVQIVSRTNGKTVGATTRRYLETEDEYNERLSLFSKKTIRTLLHNLETAISELYLEDLGYQQGQEITREKVTQLWGLAEQLREKAIAANCRDIDSYNAKNPDQKMKRLVVVIDEYADLVQAAELQGKEVRKSFESNLCMLAQRVRNLGIHLVIATQQPRATIVTSSLKAVLPFRVSFRLPSHTDSQTILDRSGAEDLLGKGDMLMMTDSDTLRMQGFFITEDQLIKFIEKKKD